MEGRPATRAACAQVTGPGGAGRPRQGAARRRGSCGSPPKRMATEPGQLSVAPALGDRSHRRLGGGQGALQRHPVVRAAVPGEDVLDRLLEQWAEPLDDLLHRHVRAEPPGIDPEPATEVDERRRLRPSPRARGRSRRPRRLRGCGAAGRRPPARSPASCRPTGRGEAPSSRAPLRARRAASERAPAPTAPRARSRCRRPRSAASPPRRARDRPSPSAHRAPRNGPCPPRSP